MKRPPRHLSGLLLALGVGLALVLGALFLGQGEARRSGLRPGSSDPAAGSDRALQPLANKEVEGSESIAFGPREGGRPEPERRASSRPTRIGDSFPGPLAGRVVLAESGHPGAGLRFWVEQAALWRGEDRSTLVETDAEGRFRLPAGYQRATLEIGRAWIEARGSDPLFELTPSRLQPREGQELELLASAPRLVLRVRGRLPDGSLVRQPRISLVGPPPPIRGRRELDEYRHRSYFDPSRRPERVWTESSEEESVFRLFPGDLEGAASRALFHSFRGVGASATNGPHLFDTDLALELSDLEGERSHTFLLRPRPQLFVRLVGAGGEFNPLGVEAWARFQSGDRSRAVLGRRASRWEFDTGWIAPGPCTVTLVDSQTGREFARRDLVLQAGEEHSVEFSRAALAASFDYRGTPSVALSGRVSDEHGQPLAGVELVVTWAGGERRLLVSGPGGDFGMSLSEDVGLLELRVAGGVAEGVFQPPVLQVPYGTTLLELFRREGQVAPVRFVFVDGRDGAVLEGLRHCVLRRAGLAGRLGESAELVDCDWDEPRLEAEYSPGADVEWSAHVPHFRPAGGRLPRTVAQGEAVEVRVPLEPGFRERLRVLDEDGGRPLVGVQVSTFAGESLGQSDRGGELAIERALWPEGLRFEREGYRTYETRLDWNGLSEHWDGEVRLARHP